MKKKLLVFFIVLVILSSIIFIVRITDPLNIKKFIYPGANYKKLPNIDNGRIIKVKNKNRDVYSYLVQKSENLIIFFHGNGDTILSFQELGKYFVKYGYSILLIEYPGYGLASLYNKNENDIYSDAEKMIEYIQGNFNFSVNRTCLFGYSLGTGVAVEMAKRKLGFKMILVSAFTSVSNVAAKNFVPVIPYLIINDNFNSILKAKNIKIPVLLIHGKKDKYIPYTMSEQLNKKLVNSEVILINEAGHNAILYVTRQDVIDKIFGFLYEK